MKKYTFYLCRGNERSSITIEAIDYATAWAKARKYAEENGYRIYAI